jgi:hypothetical protein
VWLSIAALTARVSVVMTTADFWLSWCFILYLMAGMITPSGQWEVSQPSLRTDLWHKNATISSEYAFLLVVLQFTVYFYAGLNKFIFGWTAWTSGTALQELMFDPAMHHYVRGLALHYLISLFLCYLTLAQRLIVPFWFFSWRYRRWAVIMLGLMHLGYEAVMQVTVFPDRHRMPAYRVTPQRSCVASVCSIDAEGSDRTEVIFELPPQERTLARPKNPCCNHRNRVGDGAGGYALRQRCPPYWNVKLATQLHWIMFADGGAQSKDRFKVRVKVQDPTTGRIRLYDVTDLLISYFPDC